MPSRSNGASSPKANGPSFPSLLPTSSRTPRRSRSRSAFGYIRQHLFRTSHDRASVGEDTLPPRRKSDRVFAWFSILADVESKGKRRSDFHWLQRMNLLSVLILGLTVRVRHHRWMRRRLGSAESVILPVPERGRRRPSQCLHWQRSRERVDQI